MSGCQERVRSIAELSFLGNNAKRSRHEERQAAKVEERKCACGPVDRRWSEARIDVKEEVC